MKKAAISNCCFCDSGGIRTHDLRLRRPLLYPAELQTHFPLFEASHFSVRKRVMGIEPTYPAWKAGVLPLNYTRICNAFTIISYFPENASRFLKFFIFLYLYILFILLTPVYGPEKHRYQPPSSAPHVFLFPRSDPARSPQSYPHFLL